MITKFEKKHEASFFYCVMSIWGDRDAYEGTSYEYLDPYWYEERFYDSDYTLLVSEDGFGNIYGFVLGIKEETDMRIIYMYVKPEFRRQGIGISFKQLLSEIAKNIGCKRVIAYNLYENFASVKMNMALMQG